MAVTNFQEIVESEGLIGNKMAPGQLITGRIIDIQKDWIIVDTNLKTESALPREQFNYKGVADLLVGDEVELLLESVENGLGRTQVSHGKARFMRRWLELEKAHKEEELITGTISSRVRGGFSVNVNGIKCFLPNSLIEMSSDTNPSAYENTMGKFKIIKINKARFNVVLSHKSSLEEENSEAKKKYFESLVKAGTVRGKVKKLMDFGAFIDLEIGEGLVYIADIMWKRIKHPSEILAVGDEYEFKVIDYNRAKNRLSLSLREMYSNPWDEIKGKLQEGQLLSGVVTNIYDYGFFVELYPGIVGLVYQSEIDWMKRFVQPADYVKVDDKVNVKLLSLDIEKRRISLGYKQCFNNPWAEYANKHTVGEILELPINKITKAGLFLKLTEQLSGFVHATNIDWNESPEQALKLYGKGDVVKAQIILMDANRERINLSIKKAIPNDFMEFVHKVTVKRTVVECVINTLSNKRMNVTIKSHKGDLDAIISATELGTDKLTDPADIYKVGEEISAIVWHINVKTKQIYLSVRELSEKQDKEDQKFLEDKNKKKGGFLSTIGDILQGKDKSKDNSQSS